MEIPAWERRVAYTSAVLGPYAVVGGWLVEQASIALNAFETTSWRWILPSLIVLWVAGGAGLGAAAWRTPTPSDEKPTIQGWILLLLRRVARQPRRTAGALGALLAFAVFGGFAWTRLTPVPRTIAVVPFTVAGHTARDWGRTLPILLAAEVDGRDGRHSLSPDSVRSGWQRLFGVEALASRANALNLARELGVDDVLTGTVTGRRDSVDVSAVLISTADGRVQASARVRGGEEAPDAVAAAVVDRLLQESAEAGGAGGDSANAAEPALEEYLEGQRLARLGDPPGAAAAYTRALHADPEFAPALFGLTTLPSDERPPPPDSLEALSERVRAAGRRAALSRREELLAGAWLSFLSYPPAGLRVLEVAAAEDTTDALAWYLLGRAQYDTWRSVPLPRATARGSLGRAVRLDSLLVAAYPVLIEIAFLESEGEARVRQLLEHFERSGGDPQIRLAYEHARVLAYGDSAERSRIWSELPRLSGLQLRTMNGALRQPRTLRAQARLQLESLRRPDLHARQKDTIRFQHFTNLVQRGELKAALATMQEPPFSEWATDFLYFLKALDIDGPVDAHLDANLLPVPEQPERDLLVGAYAADKQNWPRYETALSVLREHARRMREVGDRMESDFADGMAEQLEGYALGRQGEWQAARDIIETARSRTPSGISSVADNLGAIWIGRLALGMGDPEAAVLHLQAADLLPLTALEMGRAYEAAGDYRRAIATYELLVAAWENADPELARHREEAALAIDRLRGRAPNR